MMNRCKGESGRHNYWLRYRFENSSSEGDMYSSDEAPYGVYRELFGIGVSTNARDNTSTKYLTSTTINRCKGEKGRHNYWPNNKYNNYSSSEPDYSSDEILYEAPYETSDHGSLPHAQCSACSPSEYLEESSGEVEPVQMACMVVYHHFKGPIILNSCGNSRQTPFLYLNWVWVAVQMSDMASNNRIFSSIKIVCALGLRPIPMTRESWF